MRVGVLGVNHKTAALPQRERIAKACHVLFPPDRVHHAHPHILLSTCNRTELYFHSQDLAEAHSYFLHQMRSHLEESFEHQFYSYFSVDCFAHLCRVTAGLDSAIFAETEVQGQVKQTYEESRSASALPKELHFLFQKALAVSKRLRNRFSLEQIKGSLAQEVFQRLQTMFDLLVTLPVLFIGNSAINHQIYQHLHRAGMRSLVMCNRTAREHRGDQLHWEERNRWIDFPVVIVATKAKEYLLHLPAETFLSQQLVIDLGVPRNVDPRIAYLPGMTLLNLPDLQPAATYGQSNLHEIDLALYQAAQRQMALFPPCSSL